ncbi:MAG: hypothetical protein EOQ39_18550 [Mesorhizobium sp.]|uniref:hypothetical protein n=1 Tax=Mesorhizobium sp. TaxID=1871066 RepID=UPI000FE65AFC|nr:hypothetical protein [Mesorhizobium sp.]RWB08826.1 MAG: hypothetical protein EOQ37_04795 [Mesorhizobium sp.]RWB13524.1 MAG: hypothetical protein EOQ39_18550 [Mesorhizobium sp.]
MASFEIVEVTAAGNISLPHLGVFPDGKMAAGAVATMLLWNPEKKYQPRPIMVTADWRKNQKVEPLPWGDALVPITDHFARVSEKDTTMVSYFASENSGKLDRRTNTHVNRYLLEFYKDLPIDTRRRLVWQFTGENSELIKFAASADDIVAVYKSGPSSCMSHNDGFYASDENPTCAYAGPDLQLAYIEDERGHPIARTVCWPEKKIYATIYGDDEKMRAELKKLGYRKSFADFEGARLQLQKTGGYFDYDEGNYSGYLCPYIDFAHSVEPIGEYLVVTRKGSYDCKSQSGVAERNPCTCWNCGGSRNEETFYDVPEISTSRPVCEDCAHAHLKIDARELCYITSGDVRSISGGRHLTSYNFNYNSFTCPGNGQRYLNDEAVWHQGNKFSEEGLALHLEERAA